MIIINVCLAGELHPFVLPDSLRKNWSCLDRLSLETRGRTTAELPSHGGRPGGPGNCWLEQGSEMRIFCWGEGGRRGGRRERRERKRRNEGSEDRVRRKRGSAPGHFLVQTRNEGGGTEIRVPRFWILQCLSTFDRLCMGEMVTSGWTTHS